MSTESTVESTVTLGEHEFDPLATSDFRLAVEGASKTGKSNTLAVILEDLAGVPIPTLIIERLGILSSVRQEDSSLIVIGARDEPGIDLPVPLDQLDMVADLVLDEGLKVILDISTYSDLEDDRHTEHRAAATALKALNDKAQARLRTGDRRKCLAVIDEAHVLAPENNAPHIDLDEDVRRARAQIVKMSTEGGNKGITLISAYQRRAYVSKGVVSQSDNYVIHRLHATDRSEVAREIGVDEDEIEDLGTGEVLIYGDFTRQRVVGPTTVRKRCSPDPREESFEVPDPPSAVSETLEGLREEIDERERKQEQKRERIEQLEEENERLQERLEDLREQADVSERIARALEEVQSGEGSEAGEVAAELEELQERNAKLREANQRLESELEELRDRLEEREERIEEQETELSEYREIDVVQDEVVSAARTILRQLGEADPEVDELREKNADLRDRVRDLEDELQTAREAGGDAISMADADYIDFIKHDAVREAIERAKDQTHSSPRYVKGVVTAIAQEGGGVSYDEIAQRLGVSTTSDVSKASTTLESLGVITKTQTSDGMVVDLNVGGVEDIIARSRKQAEMDELMEDL